MIKNILIAALFIALSAFAISATLKSSPEPTAPAKGARPISVINPFREEAEGEFLKQTGVKFSFPDVVEGGNSEAVAPKFATSVSEGTIVYSFSWEQGYAITLFARK